MPVQIQEKHLPRGFARILWRLPIWLYRLHLGWLLQKRFLLLTHTGRKTGLPRKTMLEVIRYEKDERAKERYTVFSGWGERSDWVKNVEKTPQVTIQVGRHSFYAHAIRPSAEEAETILLAYTRKYPPRLIRFFFGLLGYQTDGTEADIRVIARRSTIVTFEVLSACAPRKHERR